MRRIARWAAPIVALGLMLGLAVSVKAEDKKETGTVTGTLVDKDGKAVANANVGVYAAGMGDHKKKDKAEKQAADAETHKDKAQHGVKGDRPKAVAEATTDSSGKFTIENVPAGEYSVRAMVKGQGRAAQKVEVKAGESVTVDLKLGETGKKK
ncbi:MAG TPA: carboxypeptidase-like regulatory domain-containing protein [Tepidisphaeraceae bacterium]|jgi:protocatechuate 3,4-dioxygenase beta subunit